MRLSRNNSIFKQSRMMPISHSRALTVQPQLLEFLAPSWARGSMKCRQARKLSTETTPRQMRLTDEQRDYLHSALRVNQAGELAATLIYATQSPPLVKAYPQLQSLMKHMYDQEAGHLSTFNKMLVKHRVRPTAMNPLWTVAASFLGWSTGMMGKEASMACTEAVETEIGEHYNNQLRELIKWTQEAKDKGEAVDEEMSSLMDTIRRIRDEELEHLDHAVEHDAKKAEAYPVLTAVIRGGCKGAIWLSERV